MNKKIALTITIVCVLSAALGYWFFSLRASSHGKAAYHHTQNILAIGPRTPGSDGLKSAQKYISTELAKSGWKTITQTIERDTPKGKRTFINLIARYQPGDIKSLDDVIKLPTKGILCAHLDSKEIDNIPDFVGADDATSACALIIVLAKTLAEESPELAKKLELVFFDGEEAFGEHLSIKSGDGLYGSRAYAISLYKRNPKPEFGILLDMVGHKNLKIAVPADSPPHLYDSLVRAAEEIKEKKRYSKLKYGVTDDHYYLNKAGVPTIDIIGDFSNTSWWHQSGDTLDNISAKSLDISYRVVLNMLMENLKK